MTGDDWGVATGHKWRLGGGGVELERGCNLEKKGGGRHTHSKKRDGNRTQVERFDDEGLD